MLSLLINTTAIWGGFLLLYFLLLRKHTFFHTNRLVLLVGLFLGLYIPQLDLSFVVAQPAAAPLIDLYFEPLTAQLQLIEVYASEETGTWAFNWSVIHWSVYFIGVVIAAARFLWGLWQLRQLFGSAKCNRQHGYWLVESSNPHLPFSFFNMLFMSEALAFSAKEKEQVIAHELAHIRGWHSLDVLLLEMLKIIFWFHPLVYLYQRAVRTTHEYIADRAVLRTNQRRQYGQFLIRQLQSRPHIAFANHLFQSQLKQRIIMMTKTKSSRSTLWQYALILPLMAFSLMAFSSKKISVNDLSNLATAEIGEVDEMPRFPGCEDMAIEARKDCSVKKLMEFIIQNLEYPKEAAEQGISGKVMLKFTVQADGSINNIKVAKGLEGGCTEAAIAVIEKMPNWIPGRKDGKAVATEMTLPFSFKPKKKAAKEEIFKVVEEMPRFPGCEELNSDEAEAQKCAQRKLLEFIYQNIKYPEEAKKNGDEGVVVVQFVVNKEGVLENAKLVRNPSESLGREVLRIVFLMNQMEERWIPGKQRGRTVNVQFNLPVKFKLDNNTKTKPITDKYLDLESFTAAPNPTDGELNITFKGEAGPTIVTITDITGKVIEQRKLENFDGLFNETFDLSNQNAGIYAISVVQGGQRYVEMIAVQ